MEQQGGCVIYPRYPSRLSTSNAPRTYARYPAVGSRDKVSIWAPKKEDYLRTSKILLPLGHYAVAGNMMGFGKPGKNMCYLSLTDEECNGVLKSVHLAPKIVNQLFPHPIK